MDLFARVQAEYHHQHAEFLRAELAAYSRSANLASEMYKAGDPDAAQKKIADGEEVYAMALRFLSDARDSKRLTIKAIQEFTANMSELRKTLDGLQATIATPNLTRGKRKEGGNAAAMEENDHNRERYQRYHSGRNPRS